MKPKIQEVIVVEGRYDKNALAQVVDATIVELGGFSFFNDAQKLTLLRRLAETRGIIVFTDPDGAGFVLRSRIKSSVQCGRVLHAYAPDVYGKEKRKKTGGKEGKLGVEGMKPTVLLDALHRAGATFVGMDTQPRHELSKADLFDLGLVGPGSAARRTALIEKLALPEHLSANALLDVLRVLTTREELSALCGETRQP